MAKGKASSQHSLNEEIAAFVARKDRAGEAYTHAELDYIAQYAGSGGQGAAGAKGAGLLYEYYTPDKLAGLCWELVKAYGYDGGTVLEPSCGTGTMLKGAALHCRQGYAGVTGFEIGKVSSTIARHRFQGATIHTDYFETAFLKPPLYRLHNGGGRQADPKNLTWLKGAPFSLVIGNPPFGVTTNRYSSYFPENRRLRQLEAFFIYKGLQLLKPGGLLCYVLPAAFLRNGNTLTEGKELIGTIADVVDAYRLPALIQTTETPLDILLLRRK